MKPSFNCFVKDSEKCYSYCDLEKDTDNSEEKELDKIRTSITGNQVAPLNTKRLEMMIKSVDGNTDQMGIYQFIQTMPIKDSQDFKKFVSENKPNLDLLFTVTAPSGDNVRVRLDFGVEFFRPFFGI